MPPVRALSTPQRALQAPRVDAPAPGLQAILGDPRFATFVDLVAPGAESIFVQPEGLPSAGGWQWTKPREQPSAATAIAHHLLAAEQRAPVPLAGRIVRAVGLSYCDDAVISRVAIDLDGRYPPPEVVARLAARVGRERLLVCSSSGRAGRFHVHARIAPMPMREARAAVAELLGDLGFPLLSGGCEVYPAKGNGRLPFGLGGCDLYTDDGLEFPVQFRPLYLAELLADRDAIDLRRRPMTARGLEPAKPATTPPPPPAKPAPLSTKPAKVAELRAGVDVARWLRDGVDAGERDAAIFALARYLRRKGRSEAQAVAELQAWIDRGGLRRSRGARRGRDLRHQRNVYVPSVVARVYAYLPPKALRAHLTAREVAAVVAIAEQRCPGDEARAVALLLDVLPRFKGAILDGFDAVRLHRDHWTRLLGRRGNGYARLRSALELFDRGPSHLRGERATTWHLRGGAFPFDPEQPERALVATTGRTFGRIYAAARAVAREA